MERNKFTPREIQILKNNPYTYELQSITSSILRSLRRNSGVDIKKENHQE